MEWMTDSPLQFLSPLDGRYADTTAPLREHFSEFAYLRDRTRLELDYLTALAQTGLVRTLSETETAQLDSVKAAFSLADAESIRAFERTTRHDVKAIEYFLRERLGGTSLGDLLPWLHFGLTSEDVNNLANALALRNSRDAVLLPALDDLLAKILDFAKTNRALPMLARTHGQPAVPTTLGKQFAVYAARIREARAEIASHRFEAKLTGAVGDFNALQAAVPQVDWVAFSAEFIQGYGLVPNLATTQILPYDNWIRYFDSVRRVNAMLIDFAQDIWRYISDGVLKQAVVVGEVGSSTMPQKVNPIDFENAEGNLGVANALFTQYAQKLAVSRLQRDLSDSTVRRTFGTAFGHTLLAWTNLRQGMNRIAADEDRLKAELSAHWEVVSEGAQTILRAAGQADAYESLKSQTRGRVLTEDSYKAWANGLNVNEETRLRLLSLSPETYLGLAVELTDKITSA